MSVLDLVGGFSARLADAWYGPPIIPDASGTEEEYYARYHEIVEDDSGKKGRPMILGKGEFGEVRLVRDKISTNNKDNDNDSEGVVYAVKILCKGYSISDDNTVYKPPKPGVLETEIQILRRLNGELYNLRLLDVYEGHRYIYLVTELCSGGDLNDFRQACLLHYQGSKKEASSDGNGNDNDDNESVKCILPAAIVREVSVRILQAVNHSARHGVIHRDLKPANIMFANKFDPNNGGENDPQDFVNDIRLIDYGSGCIDDPPPPPKDVDEQYEPRRHNTMAGSAFYNSPEMFRKSYTYKTDVWSAGVTIYVFAAGFPAGERLQKAFDTMIQPPSKGKRDLKKNLLPRRKHAEKADNIDSDDLPETFWTMLDKSLLVYSDRARPGGGEALKSCKFLHLQ